MKKTEFTKNVNDEYLTLIIEYKHALRQHLIYSSNLFFNYMWPENYMLRDRLQKHLRLPNF